jgi:hypothetical protein
MLFDALTETFATNVLAIDDPVTRAAFTGFADALGMMERDVDAFALELTGDPDRNAKAYRTGRELGATLMGAAGQISPEQLAELAVAFTPPAG